MTSIIPSAPNSLRRNPFHVIGATTRDTQGRIGEIAEERGLFGDEQACREAASVLLNPKRRLAAEVAWLPGISPGRAKQVMEGFEAGTSVASKGLPPLAQANVIAAALDDLLAAAQAPNVASILDLTAALDAVDTVDVLRDINEERRVAAVGDLQSTSILSAEIDGLRQRHLRTVRSLLDTLPSRALVGTISELVAASTASGPPSAFASDIIDGYEAAALGFIEAQTKVIEALVERAQDSASHGQALVVAVLRDLDRALAVYVEILRPIQAAKLARGLRYEAMAKVGYRVRALLLKLHKENDWLAVSQTLNGMLLRHFADVDDLSEQLAGDTAYLADRAAREARQVAEREDFANTITYAADVGRIGKARVEISPEGFRWKDTHFPLAAVTRLRWGSTRHSVNGIPTGTSFVVTVGDDKKLAVVSLGDKVVYEALVDRLWRAVGVRILIDYLRRLKSTGAVVFPGFALREDGVILTRHKVLGTNESVQVPWPKVHVWSQAGIFFIGEKGNKRVYSQVGYQTHDNVAVIEHLIRTFFKSDKTKPSELLD